MNNIFGKRATKVAVSLGACVVLTGCGALSFMHESALYQREMGEKDRASIDACSKSSDKKVELHDHRLINADTPDCYLAMVTGETTIMRNTAAPPLPTIDQRLQERVLTPSELARTTDVQILIGQVAWPALLSKVVYRRHVKEEFRSGEKDACNYMSEKHPLTELNLGAGITANQDQWLPWRLESIGCNSLGGLFYETFVYRQGNSTDGKIKQAFIVFRGTENYRGQRVEDWSANMSMAVNIAPNQFRQVRDDLPKLVAQLQAEGGFDLPIYAAGHSLGGSLAQLAVYLNPHVLTAYVFNTSPVNGWTWLRREKLDIVNDPQIVRVAQSGEALNYLRTFSNAANSTVRRTGRMDIGFDFPASRDVNRVLEARRLSGASSLHSITLLACNLAARIAQSEAPQAAFGFTKNMAVAVIKKHDGERIKGIEGLCEVPSLPVNYDVDWIAGRVNVADDVSLAR